MSGSFAYVAIILDARRRPRPGCIHPSDRGSQYASGIYQGLLASHDLVGSMSRRGNPYDNAKAESVMKALKIEAVYLIAFETFDEVAKQLPRFIDHVYNQRRLHSALGYISPVQFEQRNTGLRSNQHFDRVRFQGPFNISWDHHRSCSSLRRNPEKVQFRFPNIAKPLGAVLGLRNIEWLQSIGRQIANNYLAISEVRAGNYVVSHF